MNNETRIAILKLLSETDGSWNWLKLDRAVSVRGLAIDCNIVEVVATLSREGLVTVTDTDNPAMPTYSITSAGQNLLNSLL